MTLKDSAIVWAVYAGRSIKHGDEYGAYWNSRVAARYGLKALEEAENWRELEQDMEVSK